MIDAAVTECSFSGNISLAITSAAGADITLAASRCSGEIPMPTYAAITPPAIVAKPPVITAISSLFVRLSTYGLMSSGASVWPTKMFAEAESDSDPEVPMNRTITRAKSLTTHCRTPR